MPEGLHGQCRGRQSVFQDRQGGQHNCPNSMISHYCPPLETHKRGAHVCVIRRMFCGHAIHMYVHKASSASLFSLHCTPTVVSCRSALQIDTEPLIDTKTPARQSPNDALSRAKKETKKETMTPVKAWLLKEHAASRPKRLLCFSTESAHLTP